MNTGDEIEVAIDDITSAGWGVGRIASDTDGREEVVFVPGAAPGERVRVKISEVRKNHLRAELVEILEPSPSRIHPPCPYYEKCPGCSLQFLKYVAQCDAKAERVGRIIRRSIGSDFSVSGLIPSPEPFGYRTHLSIACEHVGDSLAIGFIDPATRAVIDIPECMLAPSWGNQSYIELREKLQNSISELPERFRLRLFFDHFEKKTYVVHTRGPKKQHRKLPSRVRKILDGFPRTETFTRTVLGVKLRLHPASFIQANHFTTQELYSRGLEVAGAAGAAGVAGMAGVEKKDVVVELYAGSGFFTLALAPMVKETIALEADRRACDNLAKSAHELVKASKKRKSKRREPTVSIVQGRAEDLTEGVLEQFSPSIVVANPPRSGLHQKVLKALAKDSGIRRIVMISCDPSTCMRDVKGLMNAGYQPEQPVLLDCYPQTAHLEIVMALARDL